MKGKKFISWTDKEAAVKKYWRNAKVAKSRNVRSVKNRFRFVTKVTLYLW